MNYWKLYILLFLVFVALGLRAQDDNAQPIAPIDSIAPIVSIAPIATIVL